MPELPEVETVVNDLRDAGLVGRRVVKARVHWPRMIATSSAKQFSRAMEGQQFAELSRRAKYIVASLSNGQGLLIHLRMTGNLRFRDSGTPRDPHEHVVLLLDDDRELRYRDPRKFGRWYLLDDVQEKLGGLGPEPLAPGFTADRLRRIISGRRGILKPLLLNQAFIAGLGNIYVDEALWDAGLHPQRSAESLSDDDVGALYRAIRKVLRRGVRSLGASLGKAQTNFYSVGGRRGRAQDGFKVFRRTGEPCPRCKTPIERTVIAQRGTHLCPVCQVADVGKLAPPQAGWRA
ncbi:MAG: bifunctional DNA-formamidopyrimidine glycosylase/DNA-(apurinic or apyrimidinic site) lyase [Verrucomicrobia bacterium]|nr:bifunctional DNA-formamidopyrimidine glycosylase/DNA-(apurinic or apyrimidinic site) lyase [Verrucomicrobiota bacterium]MDA1085855.1 bifunctional DNA-formamidopyrimidine glycosylase/DNA-(apurinic or apyrimidinic site) lyase [Verrucomicrobiota bacterium]